MELRAPRWSAWIYPRGEERNIARWEPLKGRIMVARSEIRVAQERWRVGVYAPAGRAWEG